MSISRSVAKRLVVIAVSSVVGIVVSAIARRVVDAIFDDD